MSARFPPGRNVGTQLRALRRRAARREADARAAVDPAPALPPRAALQLSLPSAEGWFAARGWQVFPFQRELWSHVAAGRSGLLHATTGAGKTYAAWFALLDLALQGRVSGGALRLLWITPMRALAADTVRSLAAPLADLGLDWTVGLRTGDTGEAERRRQRQRLPEALVTTPESLSLMLTRADGRQALGGLALVVVDEWHELLGSKRGVQVQLALARLRAFRDRVALPVWGLSATLGDLDEAGRALLHPEPGVVVRGQVPARVTIDTLLPADAGRFPWGGHLGLQMVEPVAREIDAAGPTLVFTNTRSQAEHWYQALLQVRPGWAGLLALHHGSLDREVRDWVETELKVGRLKAVVATSSLDLGVDFLPVERVLQIGSAKGVARLLQRAGRSGHAPGRSPRVTLVPTQALELVEAAAVRKAAAAGRVEARRAPRRPLDVLVQHLVTVALGEGFDAAALREEVRSTWSFRELADAEWDWALDFVASGGASLGAYPEYRRLSRGDDGRWRVVDPGVARRHRLAVGTIVAEAAVGVRLASGRKLGTIEESFIARLRRGDAFTFAGRLLTLLRLEDMTAIVEPARVRRAAVPRWSGTRLPLSGELADALVEELEDARSGRPRAPELERVAPLLAIQRRWSTLPARGTLVVESLASAEGRHLFAFPFAGRLVHAGLAALIAWRVGRDRPATFSIAVNDYGFELLSAAEIDWRTHWRESRDPDRGLLSEHRLLEDALASLNAGELGNRRFREIARVAGLIAPGYPGQPRSSRQLQASSGLLYQVFRRYDPGNLLLGQAEREVLEQELDLVRLRETVRRLQAGTVVFHALSRPTPFGFALMVERLREQLTTEQLADRIARMVGDLERAAADEPTV